MYIVVASTTLEASIVSLKDLMKKIWIHKETCERKKAIIFVRLCNQTIHKFHAIISYWEKEHKSLFNDDASFLFCTVWFASSVGLLQDIEKFVSNPWDDIALRRLLFDDKFCKDALMQYITLNDMIIRQIHLFSIFANVMYDLDLSKYYEQDVNELRCQLRCIQELIMDDIYKAIKDGDTDTLNEILLTMGYDSETIIRAPTWKFKEMMKIQDRIGRLIDRALLGLKSRHDSITRDIEKQEEFLSRFQKMAIDNNDSDSTANLMAIFKKLRLQQPVGIHGLQELKFLCGLDNKSTYYAFHESILNSEHNRFLAETCVLHIKKQLEHMQTHGKVDDVCLQSLQHINVELQMLSIELSNLRQYHKDMPLFFNNETLKVAVDLWCSDREAALQRYGHISGWNTAHVTRMNDLFKDQEQFNDNINNWDTSNVITMKAIFRGAANFNQPLDNWDVSSVIDMTNAFCFARSFNEPLNDWCVSSVTSMFGMFQVATSFNQPLNEWDTGKVTNMHAMFYNASQFNSTVKDWDVRNVQDMGHMFKNAIVFNQPLYEWVVRNVTDMSSMFCNAREFNQTLEVWKVNKVTTMESMFQGALKFNQPLRPWNVSQVTNMKEMFDHASKWNQPINTWEVGKVEDMSGMFNSACAFNQHIDSWNVSNVNDMSRMFQNASAFNQPLNSWDVSAVVDMCFMFHSAVAFNQPLDAWEVGNVENMEGMFRNASKFNQSLSTWDVSAVKDMSCMFYKASLFDESWDISDETDTTDMVTK